MPNYYYPPLIADLVYLCIVMVIWYMWRLKHKKNETININSGTH